MSIKMLTASFLSLVPLALCNTLTRTFTKFEDILHVSPYSAPEVTQRSNFDCARACSVDMECRVFSYNPTTGGCILSGRPDNDSITYDVVDSAWNTYYTMCPVEKGYIQFNSHLPPLCLHFVPDMVTEPQAEAHCQTEGARLVRVKTLDIYNTVSQFLIDVGCSQWIWTGAGDKEQEGVHYWNDGTRLYLGTDMWQSPDEGYQTGIFDIEDCVGVSAAWKLFDLACGDYLLPFICQYDI